MGKSLRRNISSTARPSSCWPSSRDISSQTISPASKSLTSCEKVQGRFDIWPRTKSGASAVPVRPRLLRATPLSLQKADKGKAERPIERRTAVVEIERLHPLVPAEGVVIAVAVYAALPAGHGADIMIQKHEKASNPKIYSSSLRTARGKRELRRHLHRAEAAHLLFFFFLPERAAPPPSFNARRCRGGSPGKNHCPAGKERASRRHLHRAEVAHLFLPERVSAAPPPSSNARRCRGGSLALAGEAKITRPA